MPATNDTERLLREVIKKYFLNRTDRLANFPPWRTPCPIDSTDNLDEILDAHITGKTNVLALHLTSDKAKRRPCPIARVGSYTPDTEGGTRWLCIDFDGAGHSSALLDPLGAAEDVIKNAEKLGLPGHLEQSGGGRGFHVWIFFSRKIPCADARRVGFAILPRKVELENGKHANPETNDGLEVFPKRDTAVADDEYGNMVWLPFWGSANEGCGEFYRLDDDGRWQSYVPRSFEEADADLAMEIATDIRLDEERARDERARAQRADPAAFGKPVGWDEWRKDALGRFDLSLVYGEWLTGKNDGKGWLECRDPASPSGDRNPSASVADSARTAERGTFHSFRTGESLSIFDFMLKWGRWSAFIDCAKYIADATGVTCPPPRAVGATGPEASAGHLEPPSDGPPDDGPPGPPGPGKRKRPVIVVNNRQVIDILRDAWKALRIWEEPRVYVRNGELTRLVRLANGMQIQPMSESATYGALLRCADWVKARNSPTGSFFYADKPSHELARDVLAYPHPGLPHLTTVVQAPVFDVDGRLIDEPGYDDASGVYYDEQQKIPPIPKTPNDDDLLRAFALLRDELLVDFPWTTDSDAAGMWAALILPFVRRMITGPTPIHLFEAPVAGTGKSLLADVVHIVFTGQPAEITVLSNDEDETRKKITAVLRRGKPIICIDNLAWGSKSASFAAGVTATTWADRVLGRSEEIVMENSATWLVTVNNPELNVDMARRCCRVRIDANSARPWERKKFKHANLREWAVAHRPDLVWSILTVIQHWVVNYQARPGSRTLGSFESWARTIGGILECAGQAGFLENVHQLYAQADSESGEWIEFVEFWKQQLGFDWVAASTLVDIAIEKNLLATVRGDRGPSSQRIRMGKALKRMRGRVFAGCRIDLQVNAGSGSNEYALRNVETA